MLVSMSQPYEKYPVRSTGIRLQARQSGGGYQPTAGLRSFELNHARTILDGCPLFSGIPSKDCADLVASARLKDFMRNDMLFTEGESVQQIWMLTSGVVKVTQLATDGTEVILSLRVAGDILGADAFQLLRGNAG